MVASTRLNPAPVIEIVPDRTLVDREVEIRLAGLEPGQPVTVRARMQDIWGTWESHAVFRSDAQGAVHLPSAKPLSGTYDDPDPMWLVWSMALQPGARREKRAVPYHELLAPEHITFTAEVDRKVVASAGLERVFLAPGVSVTPFNEDGLVGVHFHPSGPEPCPGILVLGGSDGGLGRNVRTAALLASRGYGTLALAYFDMEGLPAELVKIPLEYFETALRWLSTKDGVAGDRLAVVGVSKGGELALLLGATFPAVRAVVAYVPSGVVWQGIPRVRHRHFWTKVGSSWSHGGKPLSCIRGRFSLPALVEIMVDGVFRKRPVPIAPWYSAGLANQAAVNKAVIPVENINGPVLLISGQDDQVWPSSRMADMVMERLAKHNHPYPYEHLSYEGAGHFILWPYAPTTPVPLPFAMGGTAKANAFAQADSWPRVLAFLRDAFPRPYSTPGRGGENPGARNTALLLDRHQSSF